MKRLLTGVVTSMALAAVSFPSAALADERKGSRHIHVDVKDGNDTVAVTVPFALAKIALGMSGKSTVAVEIDDVELDQIRTMWTELKKEAKGELVSIDDGEESVRIATVKDQVLIEVKDRATGTVKVLVQVPESVIDALLAGSGKELDLAAALASLSSGYKGSLITVNEGNEHVRIWID